MEGFSGTRDQKVVDMMLEEMKRAIREENTSTFHQVAVKFLLKQYYLDTESQSAEKLKVPINVFFLNPDCCSTFSPFICCPPALACRQNMNFFNNWHLKKC